jgi:hypothetical protein
MRVLLDGIEVLDDCIAYRGLGFGQAVDLPAHSYEIQMPLPELVDVLEKPYATLVQELRSDYEQVGDRDPECLFKLNYPPLQEVLESDIQCLDEILKDYLYMDFFSRCFKQLDPERVLYAVNTIDQVFKSGNIIIVSGQAYEVKR